MATIIAGNFETKPQAEKAVETLLGLGIPAHRVSSFFVNAPGQHATFPIGGDHDESPGAEGADKGAAKGAAIGGAGAGAYTGALVGALGNMGDHKHAATVVERPSGVIVAVNASDHIEQALVANALRELDARQIELADGDWQAGKWVDFDPVSEPKPFMGSRQLAET